MQISLNDVHFGFWLTDNKMNVSIILLVNMSKSYSHAVVIYSECEQFSNSILALCERFTVSGSVGWYHTMYLWLSWWRHQMETFFALLALCAGNSPVTDAPVTRSVGVFFICAWINYWVKNREADDLRCHHAHYDVIVMSSDCFQN